MLDALLVVGAIAGMLAILGLYCFAIGTYLIRRETFMLHWIEMVYMMACLLLLMGLVISLVGWLVGSYSPSDALLVAGQTAGAGVLVAVVNDVGFTLMAAIIANRIYRRGGLIGNADVAEMLRKNVRRWRRLHRRVCRWYGTSPEAVYPAVCTTAEGAPPPPMLLSSGGRDRPVR